MRLELGGNRRGTSNGFLDDFLCALILTAAMSGLTYVLVKPEVGIDDANITQVYAQRLAQGEGYRYNVGGEAVEGTTSWLWTVLLVPFFAASNRPERAIAAFCGLLVIGVTMLALRLSRAFAPVVGASPRAAAIGTTGALMLFPAFFVWSVWTLMDLTLWILVLTGLLHCVVRLFLVTGEGAGMPRLPIIALMICAILTPLVRPEGTAVAIGLGGILGVGALWLKNTPLRIASLAAVSLAAASTASITLWRLDYFGQPFPNTLYAKVSTDWAAQAVGGINYLGRFMARAYHAVAIGLVTAAGLFALVNGPIRSALASRMTWCVLSVVGYVWGTLALYTLAGGDHFGFFRFFQPLVPVFAVAIGLTSCWIGRIALNVTTGRVAMASCLALPSAFLVVSELTTFVVRRGEMAQYFRIAEEGRQIGATMNSLSWAPAIGVVIAGGIARTYHGQVYDLMGLNWLRMAHAVGDLSGTVRNHGGFDPAVFFEATPDIVLPRIRPCDRPGYPDVFARRVLKNVFADPRFVRVYAPACFRGTVFFVKRDRLAASAELAEPPWSHSRGVP